LAILYAGQPTAVQCRGRIGSDVECRGRVGSDVELHCSLNYSDHNPPLNLTYEWSKNGDKTLVSNSEIIKFTPFDNTDAGGYQCKSFTDGSEVFCGLVALTTGKLVVTTKVCVVLTTCSE